MDACDPFYITAILHPKKPLLAFIDFEAGWSPEQVSSICQKEKCLACRIINSYTSVI